MTGMGAKRPFTVNASSGSEHGTSISHARQGTASTRGEGGAVVWAASGHSGGVTLGNTALGSISYTQRVAGQISLS